MGNSKEKAIIYSEPADFFPKELREEFKLGEFAEDTEDEEPVEDEDEEDG